MKIAFHLIGKEQKGKVLSISKSALALLLEMLADYLETSVKDVKEAVRYIRKIAKNLR